MQAVVNSVHFPRNDPGCRYLVFQLPLNLASTAPVQVIDVADYLERSPLQRLTIGQILTNIETIDYIHETQSTSNDSREISKSR
jgi:hypothetical protein